MLYKEPFVLYLNVSVCIILLFLSLPSLLNRKEGLRIRLAFFLIFFIVIATCVLNLIVLFFGHYRQAFVGYFVFFISLLFGPAIYFYVKNLLGSQVEKWIFFSLIPGVLSVGYGTYLAFAGPGVQQEVFQKMLAGQHLFYEVTNLLTLVLTLVYCVKAWYFIKRFEKGINPDEEVITKLKVAWAREFVIYMFANVFVFLILVLALTNFSEVTTMDMDLIGMPVFMLFVYLLVAVRSMMMYKEFEHQFEIARIETDKQMQAQRLEIARDLHDSLGAQLTLIASVSEGIKSSPAGSDKYVRDKAEVLSEFTENAIAELKNALWILNADEVRLEDLKNRILNFVRAAGEAREDIKYHATFSIEENVIVGSKWVVNSFRIVQELINNASKHSNAKNVWISLNQIQNMITLEIRDDGVGFERDEMLGKSFGLSNLKQRVDKMGGVIHTDSGKGKGTTCTIQMKL